MLSKSILDTVTFKGLFGSYFDSYDVAEDKTTETEKTTAYSGYDEDYFHAYSGLLEEN